MTQGFNNRAVQRPWLGTAVILLAALAAIAPELVRGSSCGHDFDFHLVSWMDALRAWHAGIVYPHWTPSANWGAGEPRFVFYPPLTWMLGAALGAVLPWAWVPAALTFVLLAVTGLGSRALAREVLDEGAATLAGVIAIFSGYALFTAYERTAFAELAGGLWIPLAIKYTLRGKYALCGLSFGGWRAGFDGSAALLAIAITGAWLSNPTVGVMACYLVVALAAIAGLLDRAWAPVARAAVGLAVGMGLTAVYLAPVALEQGWADLNEVNLSPGQTLENNWLFARHADPVLEFHDDVLHQVSLVVVAMVALTLLAFALCWLRGRLPGSRRWWLPLALVPLVVLFLQLPLSHPVWVLLPKLRYLQFPWRWLVALEAPMGVFLAAAVWPRAGWRRWLAGAVATLTVAVCVGHASRNYFQVCDEEDSVPGTLAAWSVGQGFRGMDEYMPMGTDNSLVAEGLPDACLVRDAQQTLGQPQPMPPDAAPDDDQPPPLWAPAQQSCERVYTFLPRQAAHRAEHYEFKGAVAQPGFLILHLHRYPAWLVRVNGRKLDRLPQRPDGLVAVPLASGPFDLTVDWVATPDVLLGRWVSGFSVFLLAGLVFFERRLSAARIE